MTHISTELLSSFRFYSASFCLSLSLSLSMRLLGCSCCRGHAFTTGINNWQQHRLRRARVFRALDATEGCAGAGENFPHQLESQSFFLLLLNAPFEDFKKMTSYQFFFQIWPTVVYVICTIINWNLPMFTRLFRLRVKSGQRKTFKSNAKTKFYTGADYCDGTLRDWR